MMTTTILQASIPGSLPFDSSVHSYSNIPSMNLAAKPETKPSYIHAEYERPCTSSAPSSAPSSPTYTQYSRQDSYNSTPASSLSLDNDIDAFDDDDEDIVFPSYEVSSGYTKADLKLQQSEVEDDQPSSSTASLDIEDVPAEQLFDDQAIEHEPTRHVDYLSHEWKEEDIWSSWRYIVARRKKITNSVRLENAAWRTWMKSKYDLKTVSPETLNWLKDCDVTWLYGPLQHDTKHILRDTSSQPASRLSVSSSFVQKKPILKKKSASAAILERSRSQQSLLQRAGEIIRVQQSSPANGRPVLIRTGTTEFTLPSYSNTSVANTPAEDLPHRQSFGFPDPQTPVEQKHVAFDQEVRQVQAVDSEDDERDIVDEVVMESDEDDDGGLIMAPIKTGSGKSTPRGSFNSGENLTIVPLPSTTLKYRTDTPEPTPVAGTLQAPWTKGRTLSPSPSQETLRPSRPHHNFLIDDDPEVSDEPWQTSDEIGYSPYEDENESGPQMRRTPSGMFMPYDEDEEERIMDNTLFGQARYAVNTFKDIAHVVWNVGWNRK